MRGRKASVPRGLPVEDLADSGLGPTGRYVPPVGRISIAIGRGDIRHSPITFKLVDHENSKHPTHPCLSSSVWTISLCLASNSMVGLSYIASVTPDNSRGSLYVMLGRYRDSLNVNL